MQIESLPSQAIAAFVVTLASICALAPIAHVLKLTDAPSSRKHHDGEVPLVGGIAVFIALVCAGSVWGDVNQTLITVNGNDALWIFMGCGAILVSTGILDDRFQLSVLVRVLLEVLVAIVVIESLDLTVAHLGDLCGSGNVFLDETASYAFTVVAIFGIINAFNMLDGIDGLLASLVITSLLVFHLVTGVKPGFASLAVGASLMAFLISNLSLSPIIPKTFLGDSGSKLLGFIVVSLLLAAASAQVGNAKLIQPVTALFIVALPLFDMVFTSLRRIIKRVSPFSADRSHIHHLMKALGFSDRRTLAIILCIHTSLTFIGLILHRAETPEYYKFAIFLGCFVLYSFLCSQLWLAASRLQIAQLEPARFDPEPRVHQPPNEKPSETGVNGENNNRR